MNSRFFILTSLALTLAGIFGGLNEVPGLDSGDATLYQEPDSVVAMTLYQRALHYFRAGDIDRAFDRATEGLQYAMRSGHTPTELDILNLLADISVTEGHPGMPFLIRYVWPASWSQRTIRPGGGQSACNWQVITAWKRYMPRRGNISEKHTN